MFRLTTFILCFAIMAFPYCIRAETPPIPKDKSESLSDYNKRIKQENERKLVLEKKHKTISNSLSNTKNKLVKLAENIQKNEEDIKKFEQKILNIELRKSILEDKLNSDKASISRLILALERIRRTPPEAMIALPETPYKTAQSAMLMGNIVLSVNRHAETLNKNLEMLDSVTKELEQEKHELALISKELKSSHAELLTLLNKRKNLYEKIGEDITSRKISIQKISLKAKNLEDLLTRIKKDEEKEAQRKIKSHIKTKKPLQKIIDNGKIYLPISGVIRTTYHQKDNVGAISKGLTIEGRPSSLVVAPMNGKIQFTGTFKRYGNIIIIEHANNYHSLIAGIDKITAVVGDYIKSGEPIGILPNSSLILRPTLYYELRKNGRPINPSIKFPSLG